MVESEKLHFSKKVTARELEKLEGETLRDKLTNAVDDLVEKIHQSTDKSYHWFLYDRWPNGPEEDVIILIQNFEIDAVTKCQMQFNYIGKYYI